MTLLAGLFVAFAIVAAGLDIREGLERIARAIEQNRRNA
jgi:hypothetical protein